MRIVELRTESGKSIVRAKMVHSLRARWRGLVGETALDAREGLLIVPGGSVHTFGLSFAIDAVFLDRHMRVIELLERIPPWRFIFAPACTRMVLELRSGTIAATGLVRGACLCACFDEEDEETVPAARPSIPDSTPRPRPTAPCISFSLRLPLENKPRGVDLRHPRP